MSSCKDFGSGVAKNVLTLEGASNYHAWLATIQSFLMTLKVWRIAVELCSALGWDLNFPRPSSYVSCARPVGTGPYYQFSESQEPSSHGRPAGLTLFRF